MKILCISDEESRSLWDYGTPEKLQKYDLILACGDLKAEYLSFLVTLARCPLLYVHGNHDTDYAIHPPEGCDCIDGSIVVYNGLRIMGLGGCRKYRKSPHHYTDRKMAWRIFRLKRKLKKIGGADIIVTHASPEGLGDLNDYAHRGFPCFRTLLEQLQPNHWLFGHSHLYANTPRILHHQNTTLINCCGTYELDLPNLERKDYSIQWITRKPHIKDEWNLP